MKMFKIRFQTKFENVELTAVSETDALEDTCEYLMAEAMAMEGPDGKTFADETEFRAWVAENAEIEEKYVYDSVREMNLPF